MVKKFQGTSGRINIEIAIQKVCFNRSDKFTVQIKLKAVTDLIVQFS